MSSIAQKLQMKDWKRLHKDEYRQYCKDYYTKNKLSGQWKTVLVREEDRKIMKGRTTAKTLALDASRGWRDIKGLERYKFPKIKHPNALPSPRGWVCGKAPGTLNRPTCMIMGCEKKVGSFTVLFE